MTDLHESSDPKYSAQIDTVGWIFVAFAVAITVIAAVVAYHGSGTMIANTPVSHIAGSHYSITSSARTSSDGGTSRPSALAVLRLTTVL
jgi:hypothetical protein